MKKQISASGESFRSMVRGISTWWLVPLGIPGLLDPGGNASHRHLGACAELAPPVAFARSPATVKLPAPRLGDPRLLEEILRERRSIRAFTADSLTLAEVSLLLWAGQGITDAEGGRSAPSAGALYPLDLFLVAGGVHGLDPGVYQYRPAAHELTGIATGDKRAALCSAALDQDFVRSAPVAIVITGTYGRTTRKYGERGIRYVHMEVGCAAENISLAAAALGLGTVIVGAFEDQKVSQLLNLPAKAEPLCILPVGRPGVDRPE